MRWMAIILLLAAGTGLALTEDNAGDTTPASPRVADIAKNYGKLKLMTPQAVFVDPELAMLCRGASAEEVEAAKKKSGPHAHTAIRIFMNEQAAKAFRHSAKVFPVGSIVVKEKKGMGYDDAHQERNAKTHDGVGGMVKRSRGFDPDHGDWEYFYFEDAAKIETGKIASCVRCHAGAAATDHVFGSWAKAP